MAGEFFPNSICIWFSPLHPNKATDELAGLKLYKPHAVAWYMVIGLPLGLFVYGLNIARRGQQWFGYSVSAFSGLVYIVVAALVHMGTVPHQIYLHEQGFLFDSPLSVLLALFVQFMEQRPYRVAVNKGATPAWWWPPMSWAIGVHLALYLFNYYFSSF